MSPPILLNLTLLERVIRRTDQLAGVDERVAARGRQR
jgi:hypothetical protein